MKSPGPAALAALLPVAACGDTRDRATPQAPTFDAPQSCDNPSDERVERDLEVNALRESHAGEQLDNDRLANPHSPGNRRAARIDRRVEARF